MGDGKTMVIDPLEYKEMMKNGELPRPVNESTGNQYGSNEKEELLENNTTSDSGTKRKKHTPLNDEHTAINEWKQERAPDGRLYFYNSRTGESSFHKPDELRLWEDKQKE